MALCKVQKLINTTKAYYIESKDCPGNKLLP